jgi:hypothetical protein
MTEIWKKHSRAPFNDWYEVSSHGNIRRRGGKDCAGRTRPAHIVKSWITGIGYRQAMLQADRQRWYPTVHRLVAETFLPNADPALEVHHINGVKTDNRLENLKWVTKKQNQLHCVSMSEKRYGEQHCKAKLTNNQVIEIRVSTNKGIHDKVLASQYGVSHNAIYNIRLGRTWKHII